MKIKYVLNVNESAPDGTMFSGMQVEEPIRDYAVVSNVYSGWVDDVQEHMGDNYSFKEWNTERDGSGTAYHAGDKLYESTTLYTVWNGETLMPETMEISKGDKRYWFNVLTNFERTKISNALTASSVREYDVVDFSDWAEWESGNSYEVGDRVKYTYTIVHTSVKGWICIVANSSDTLETTEWEQVTKFPTPGEKDVLYIAKLENKAYYWDGDNEEYVCISGDTEGKADKVINATSGNFAGLDSNGNLIDSGHKHSDYLTEHQDISGKMNVSEKGAANGVASLDANGHVPSSQLPSTLPAVTSSDEGKVLQVSSGGEWVKGTEKIDKHYDSDGTEYAFMPSVLNGMPSYFNASKIWTDGDNVYYSDIYNQYVLDKSTSTWVYKTWNGLKKFDRSNIWTDGDNIYFSNGHTQQYVLDKYTSTWNIKTWTGFTNFTGSYIWTDGENIYSSFYSTHHVLDKSTSTWSTKTWTGLTNFQADNIWTDGDNIYYSYGSSQYILDKSTSTWSAKTWTGLTNLYGQYIWTDGANIYYSHGSQYVLDKSTSTWSTKTWTGLTSFYGTNVWIDGENIYCSTGESNYILNKSTSTWTTKTWTGLTNFRTSYVWKDGENIYYSSSDSQYIFDKSTSTWSAKIWTGLTSFDGNKIWTDGDNIYYSKSSKQYVLDTSTSVWSAKSWVGLTKPDGQYIWTDGDNIYYSYGPSQYVLDKSTSTWSEKTWTGLTDFYADYIWINNGNIYYSCNSDQYILDKLTSTWSVKTWNGLTSFLSMYIWVDNNDVYFSNDLGQYVLDESTSTWSAKTWAGLADFYGDSVWSDGENLYYKDKFKYSLAPTYSNKILFGSNGAFNAVNANEIIPDINGKADLVDGKVPASQLPSYVDDVLEYSSISQFPAEGESGKIYVDTSTNITYRWSGSTYVAIGSDLALGETSSTAYRGDRGKAAYDAAVVNVDSTPTTNSTHLITSGGVKASLPGTMTGATSSAAGTSGLVPAPSVGDEEKFLKGDGTWDDVDALPIVTSSDNNKVLEVVNGEWTTGSKKINKEYELPTDWTTKTWTGVTPISGGYIWSDGENIYYSYNSNQYVLDKSTSTWIEKTWTGLTNFSGDSIWSDGENVYYSNGSSYMLDKSTSTWSSKTWTGLTKVYANYIWSDGDNIYHSNGYSYILDKSTSTWSSKTWIGLENFSGVNIWSDGENVYYSYNSNQYVLDKSTSTWSSKTWSGLTSFAGEYIWSDGDNVYYSNSSNQYLFNSSTTVESKILLGTNGEFNSINLSSFADLVKPSDMTGASSSAAGTHGLVPAPAQGDQDKFLKGDGTWGEVNTSSSTVSKVSFTIATTDWTQSSNTYVADVTDSHITSTTEELIMYTNSVKNLTSDIDTNKDGTNNKITFIVDSVPTGSISGSIYIISQGNIVADTKVDINQGVENAGKFLVVNSQGNVEPVTMQAWQGGSY